MQFFNKLQSISLNFNVMFSIDKDRINFVLIIVIRIQICFIDSSKNTVIMFHMLRIMNKEDEDQKTIYT